MTTQLSPALKPEVEARTRTDFDGPGKPPGKRPPTTGGPEDPRLPHEFQIGKKRATLSELCGKGPHDPLHTWPQKRPGQILPRGRAA